MDGLMICNHADETDYCERCDHSTPHARRDECEPAECADVGHEVKCIEVEDD